MLFWPPLLSVPAFSEVPWNSPPRERQQSTADNLSQTTKRTICLHVYVTLSSFVTQLLNGLFSTTACYARALENNTWYLNRHLTVLPLEHSRDRGLSARAGENWQLARAGEAPRVAARRGEGGGSPRGSAGNRTDDQPAGYLLCARTVAAELQSATGIWRESFMKIVGIFSFVGLNWQYLINYGNCNFRYT